MKEIKTTIEISAPVAQVWAVLTDFDRYGAWNPFIRKSQGTGAVGTRLTNEMHLAGQKPQTFTPKVLVNDSEREFRWLGRFLLPGIFDGEHYFLLESTPEGGTRLTHGEKFRGLLAGPIMKKIGEATLEGFEAMNKALAQRVA